MTNLTNNFISQLLWLLMLDIYTMVTFLSSHFFIYKGVIFIKFLSICLCIIFGLILLYNCYKLGLAIYQKVKDKKQKNSSERSDK